MTQKSLRDRLFEDAPQEPEKSPHDLKGPTQQIFNPVDVFKAIAGEQNDNRLKILSSLRRQYEFRQLACFPDDFLLKLKILEKQFGNFHEVTAICRNAFILGALEPPNVINLPPILLLGPPGIGKTRYLSELAMTLGTAFFDLDFSSLTSGFIISGGSSSWQDSKPGFISNSLLKSDFANPIILLDEIDKAQTGSNYDPLGPMYGLLEKHTAKRFVDEFLNIKMDASAIIWVASANYPERIPEPIRSRMIEIFIDTPTPEQSYEIVKAIYRELLNTRAWGKHFSVELDPKVIVQLSSLPARRVRIALENALAVAAIRSRGKMRPIIVMPQDVSLHRDPKNKFIKMGFLA
ncbi:ATP-dependent protease La [Methylophaga lonarensis MPL]|uniref:ATP-dependent protease La n=1 Tax=Methylophaga lonarensis MPL TaxID=1286106 RepID=M7PDS0_9GAMM|nr:AAA family ATPase [Methylophaga lonarensis]EMR12050.1 ATP-dependent protease La [Methylophaga lonarensis MPL]